MSGPRLARHSAARLHSIALVVAVLLVAVVGFIGVNMLRHGLASDGGLPKCPTSATDGKDLPLPAQVQVSVLNGTQRAGLASETENSLSAQGFVVTDVGNAPAYNGIGLIQYGPGGQDAAKLLAYQIPGVTLREVESAGKLTLTLGAKFKDVASPADVAKAMKHDGFTPIDPSATATCQP